MFAGPNGSGKSTLKATLREDYPKLCAGVDISPDDVERWVREEGVLDLDRFGIVGCAEDLMEFMARSKLLNTNDGMRPVQYARVNGSILEFSIGEFTSYHATVVCHYVRNELLKRRESFTIETVMSSSDKIELLEEAKTLGYRNYLYFVATSSPEINVSRVVNRVFDGGHGVPERKIRDRYLKSLSLLKSAVRLSSRAYIFDNSQGGGALTLVAEVTDGQTIKGHAEKLPEWVEAWLLSD